MIRARGQMRIHALGDCLHAAIRKKGIYQPIAGAGNVIVGQAEAMPAVDVIRQLPIVLQRMHAQLTGTGGIALEHDALFGRKQRAGTENPSRHGTVLRPSEIRMRSGGLISRQFEHLGSESREGQRVFGNSLLKNLREMGAHGCDGTAIGIADQRTMAHAEPKKEPRLPLSGLRFPPCSDFFRPMLPNVDDARADYGAPVAESSRSTSPNTSPPMPPGIHIAP